MITFLSNKIISYQINYFRKAHCFGNLADADLGLLQHQRWGALWKPLIIITERSILDVATALDLPL